MDQCTAGYTGPTCATDFDECASYPCKNGGSCVESTTVNTIALGTYDCKCAPGFANGLCAAGAISQYAAKCSVKGAAHGICNVDMDECLSSPCLNGGTCADSTNTAWVSVDHFVCSCDTGFTGYTCNSTSGGRRRLGGSFLAPTGPARLDACSALAEQCGEDMGEDDAAAGFSYGKPAEAGEAAEEEEEQEGPTAAESLAAMDARHMLNEVGPRAGRKFKAARAREQRIHLYSPDSEDEGAARRRRSVSRLPPNIAV